MEGVVLNSVFLPKNQKLTTINNRNKNDTVQFCQQQEKLNSLSDYSEANKYLKVKKY